MITLEFAIERTVIRRIDVDEEDFKDALYITTPPPLREAGLPFDRNNVLHTKQYVLALWKFFFFYEEPESRSYTGLFIDSLTVTNYKDSYSIPKLKSRKRPASESKQPVTINKRSR
jgi:hypothetical protein